MKLLQKLKASTFIKEEKGSQVLEIVIVIAVLLAVALLFNQELKAFANQLFGTVFSDSSIFEVLG